VTPAVVQAPAAELLTTRAIRERCANVTRAVEAGDSRYFRVDRSKLESAARAVADVTRRRYPSLEIPYHSRWRHFAAGHVDRKGEFDRRLKHASADERLRAQIDLDVISVLLDAGAGNAWSYREPGTVDDYVRSEGLGVATFCAFLAGAFSASPGEPMRVDAAALTEIDAKTLGRWLQVRSDNPLAGLEGRVALLRRLGDVLETRPDLFGLTSRPAALFDRMRALHKLPAPAILRALLEAFGPIWRANPRAGEDADARIHGDVWRHRNAGGSGATAGYVPFHKLTQWLTYSLFEPFEWAGHAIGDRDALTALPEYRNGGLLIDSGVLQLVDDADREKEWDVGSEIIVEWRALTVTLLDDLAQFVRAELARPDLPLACVLEGGTWFAGREFAARFRNGEPPLKVKSDGTVF
jgi:hypothetical protein